MQKVSLLEKDDLHLTIKDIMNCIIFTLSLCVFVCIIRAKFGDDLQICISIRNDKKSSLVYLWNISVGPWTDFAKVSKAYTKL